MKGFKNVVSLSIVAGFTIFALPRLEMGEGFTPPTLFAIAWLSMMLLMFAAHLHELIGVDEETKQQLQNVKKYRQWKTENYVRSKVMRDRR